MTDNVQLDWDLIRRYDTRGPRYTSYPTALQFTDRFSESDYVDQVRRSRESTNRPLSVYIHIPFCEHLCFYCACNKIATRNRTLAEDYLGHLLREIDLRSPHFGSGGHIEQLHFGGGTPTFLTAAQLESILDALRKWFSFSEDAAGDYSIEIDPRTVSPADMRALRDLGFNRVSLGVQDFDPAVQLAVHRIQPREQTLSIMQAARDSGMRSVNVDLIYGLPKQSVASVRDTLGQVIDAAPDRISLFNYAHLPERFTAQRRIRDEDLPDAEDKLEMLKTSVEMVTDAGYVYIGMDHFALPGDELARAKSDGTLHRTFQGYTTHAGCELVGFGVSSIGHTGRCLSQNAHDIREYQESVAGGHIPVARGVILDDDDMLRAELINSLMCFGELDMPAIEHRYGIDFEAYFDAELERLEGLQADGLVRLEPGRVSVTPRGWMLVRNICASFDRYLPEHQADRFSRTI